MCLFKATLTTERVDLFQKEEIVEWRSALEAEELWVTSHDGYLMGFNYCSSIRSSLRIAGPVNCQ